MVASVAVFRCAACGGEFAEWEATRDEDTDADTCPYCGSLWIDEIEEEDWPEPECDEG
jgi:DNA-directed RNA polymerase subunit RPC12/RpoP